MKDYGAFWVVASEGLATVWHLGPYVSVKF